METKIRKHPLSELLKGINSRNLHAEVATGELVGREKERRHRDGYASKPVAPGEFDAWEREQVWPAEGPSGPAEVHRVERARRR